MVYREVFHIPQTEVVKIHLNLKESIYQVAEHINVEQICDWNSTSIEISNNFVLSIRSKCKMPNYCLDLANH